MPFVVVVVPPMPPVHEKVHQGTSQQDQIRKRTQQMGSVLVKKEIGCDAANHDQAKRITRTPETLWFL
jgi:hypothetical protein